jgi:hypothetical protein
MKQGEDTMHMALLSRLIFPVIGVTLPIAAHLADMNKTHIYEPHWPPHAKFHNDQTLSMSIFLGALRISLAWWPSNDVPAMVEASAVAAGLYFIKQSTAILYPNTAYVDPEFNPQTVPRPFPALRPRYSRSFFAFGQLPASYSHVSRSAAQPRQTSTPLLPAIEFA